MSASTPVIFDDGSKAFVPQGQLSAALKDGGKVAQAMLFDDGSKAYVPLDKVHDAIHDGGQLMGMPPAMAPGAPSSQSMQGQYLVGGAPVPASRSVGESDDPNWKMDEYRRVKTAAGVASVLALPEASIPSLLAGVTGGAVGNVAGKTIAAKSGAGSDTQELAGDAGGLLGGVLSGSVGNYATSKARAIYSALPDGLQKELLGIASPRLKNALHLWDALDELSTSSAKPATPELDATGENRAYAGASQPKAQPPLDATGENKPFAGGIDEWTPKQVKAKPTLADLDPATGARKAAASKSVVAQPSPQVVTAQPPVNTQAATGWHMQAMQTARQKLGPEADTSAVLQEAAKIQQAGPNDPLLERLRVIAKGIEEHDKAQAAIPKPEDDLTDILLQSLKQVRAKKGLTVQ